jgi:O-antigen ligase
LRSVLPAIGGAVLVLAVASPIIGARYGGLLITRFIGDTTSTDPVSASSGRLDIWAGAIARMAETPITFLTGFGWNVYAAMPFRLAPHNHYMALWFDLGVIGVVCGVALLVLCARESSQAAHCAAPNERPILIGFAISTVAISTATFFVDLYTPWLWFWAYAGIVLRIAVNARRQATVASPERVEQPQKTERTDAFGWSAPRVVGSRVQQAPRYRRR